MFPEIKGPDPTHQLRAKHSAGAKAARYQCHCEKPVDPDAKRNPAVLRGAEPDRSDQRGDSDGPTQLQQVKIA